MAQVASCCTWWPTGCCFGWDTNGWAWANRRASGCSGARLYALAILALDVLVARGDAGLLPQGRRSEDQGGVLRIALRQLPALVAAAVLVLALYGLLAWAAGASGQPAFRLASWLTLKLRTPVKPVTVARVFLAGFWIVRWVVLPVALLPMASGIACARMARLRRVDVARRMALLAGGPGAAGGGIAAALRVARLGARG